MWTKMQEKVINTHGNNILVSAAAGSGKTAVLVERIVTMIVEQNVGIDELVVVTFTRAAAAEMKERIREKLEEKLEKDPDNVRIADQITLVGNAMICTIDSFCLNLIKENFLEAGLDPAFRHADGSEVQLMERAILKDIIEKHYMTNDISYIETAQIIGPGKAEEKLGEIIMDLYQASKACPWPLEWLDEVARAYSVTTEEELLDMKIIEKFFEQGIGKTQKIIEEYENLIAEANAAEGFEPYVEAFEKDVENIEDCLRAKNFKELTVRAGAAFDKYSNLPRFPKDAVDEAVKKKLGTKRSSLKGDLKDLAELGDSNKIITELGEMREIVQVMVDVAKELYIAVAEKKKEKNIIDFNDMERLALNLLVKKEEGKIVYTEVADRLAHKYAEILIDEYQDSNYIQESILTALSRERFGEANMFMVGDVKQSIYGFRQAVPKLFIDKYNAYSADESKGIKIELQANFRSRPEILDAVNAIFFPLMKHYFGGIEYNDDVKLNPGKKFLETDEYEHGGKCEVLLINSAEVADADDVEAHLEAAAIARKIKEMMNPDNNYRVLNKAEDGYRRLDYDDFAILLRSGTGFDEVYANVLMNAGIPVTVEKKEGIFDVIECKWVLDVLACIDNPYQDISLASAMTSYFGGFSKEELAIIRSGNKEKYLYEALLEQAENNEKIAALLQFFEDTKVVLHSGNLYDLMWFIVHTSGFYKYAGTMPAGDKRQANLDALINKAKDYEKSQMKGLFNFLRYIEEMKKYKLESGDMGGLYDEKAVRIVTVHKSKGLQYPVVFLGRTMRGFNFGDRNQPVLINPELGIGIYKYNKALRYYKKDNLYRNTISGHIHNSLIAEEMRLLYVALTRAKEKLFIVGASSKMEDIIIEQSEVANKILENNNTYTYPQLEKCESFYKMYLPSVINNPDLFDIEQLDVAELISFLEKGEEELRKSSLKDAEKNVVAEYPYEKYTAIRSKFSVSEIKHMGHASDEEDYEKPAQLIKAAKGYLNVEGATRGTAYHRVMECLNYADFDLDNDSEELLMDKVKAQIEKMVEKNLFRQEDADTITVSDIVKFITSELGRRVAAAAAKGLVKREQPFVYGVAAGSLPCYADMPECDEMVLVQGEIDLYFFEDDKIILVDYKTDRVQPDNGRERLTSMYQEQLKSYADALQRISGDKYTVAERIIYSFTLGDFFQV